MSERGTRKISGARWKEDISFEEMMVFWGILIKMTLRPTPGQCYTSCWNDQRWHPYTNKMDLRRFQQIRSVLHLNDESNMAQEKDSLAKVRLLLNCLKVTFPSYIDLGDDVALDEASIGCRSKYGRHLIFYNSANPDKYHFRFYFLCCATTYACVRLRIHTSDESDYGDPMELDRMDDGSNVEDFIENVANDSMNNNMDGRNTNVAEQNEDPGKLVGIILDMCKPLYGSGRVVNMDNWYTSPTAAVLLSKKNVYMRGTCRANRKGFPSAVKYNKGDAKKLARGTMKMMVDSQNHIAAYGWLDNSPVQMITTADGSANRAQVSRQVGKDVVYVNAPQCLERYNQLMQGVDRHDQMRALFSLVNRHGFKKYYVKIILGLIDMAITNAWIHYKMVNKELCKNPRERYYFMDRLADSLLETKWKEFNSSQAGRVTDSVFQSLCNVADDDATPDERNDMRRAILNSEEFENVAFCRPCKPMTYHQFMSNNRNNRGGLRCQVCLFEGVKSFSLKYIVICGRHALRLCSVAQKRVRMYKAKGEENEEVSDFSWMAPAGMTCWDKAHKYYIPKGLFKENPVPIDDTSPEGKRPKFQQPKTSSYLYRSKRLAFGLEAVVTKRKKSDEERIEDVSRVEDVSDGVHEIAEIDAESLGTINRTVETLSSDAESEQESEENADEKQDSIGRRLRSSHQESDTTNSSDEKITTIVRRLRSRRVTAGDLGRNKFAQL